MTLPQNRFAYWQDGIIPLEEVRVSPYDLGFLRGYGVFDVMRTENAKPFLWEQHWERLKRSAKLLNLRLPVDAKQYKGILDDLLARNGFSQSIIRTLLSGGESDNGFTLNGNETFMILIEPFQALDEKYYREGATVITLEYNRSWPEAKITNYVAAIREAKRREQYNALEILFRQNGEALEASTSNFAIFLGDTLVVPKENVLQGITLGLVSELARDSGFTVEERPVLWEEVLRADEMFLTATNKYIVPVVRVDEYTIGRGVPGDRTKVLMAALKVFVDQY